MLSHAHLPFPGPPCVQPIPSRFVHFLHPFQRLTKISSLINMMMMLLLLVVMMLMMMMIEGGWMTDDK